MFASRFIVPLVLVSTLTIATAAPKLDQLKGVWRSDFNADASRVIVQMRDGGIGLWNATDGSPVAGNLGNLTTKGTYVIDSAARQVLVGAETGGSRVYDLTTGQALSPPMDMALVNQEGPVPAAFTPDGSQVMMITKGGAWRVHDVKSGNLVASVTLPPDSEDREIDPGPAFSKDGKSAFILDANATLHRYDTQTWKESGTPMQHPNQDAYSCGFALSDDGCHAVTFDGPGENGPSGSLQLWDLAQGGPIGAPLVAKNGMSGRFMDAGKRLLVSPGRGDVRVVKVPSMETDFVLPRHDDVEASRALVTTDGRKILTWGYNSMVHLTDSSTGKIAGVFSNRAQVRSVHVGPDSDSAWLVFDNSAFVLQGRYDYYVVRMDLGTMKPAAMIRFTAFLHRVIFSKDGSRIMVHKGTTDHEVIRLFDAKTFAE